MATIPKPKYCDQEWLNMKPTNGGRLCGKCGHTLQNFTKKTWADIEIIQTESNNTICGMYTNKQLEHWGHEVPKPKPASKWMVAASFLLAPLLHFKNEANAQTPTVQQEQYKLGKIKADVPAEKPVADSADLVVIKGVVMDKETKETIPFANVVLKDGDQQIGYAPTDMNGAFAIQGSFSKETLNSATLEIIQLGYERRLLRIKDLEEDENIFIKISPHIISFSVYEPTSWQRFKWKIRSWFQGN